MIVSYILPYLSYLSKCQVVADAYTSPQDTAYRFSTKRPIMLVRGSGKAVLVYAFFIVSVSEDSVTAFCAS